MGGGGKDGGGSDVRACASVEAEGEVDVKAAGGTTPTAEGSIGPF